MTESTAKMEIIVPAGIAAAGAIGISFHDLLEWWLLVASVVAMTAGALAAVWKLWRDVRGAHKKDRRQGDRNRLYEQD